ncbi:MAG: metallophosphoesterase family protein [Phycisphaeraceae bacterium]
MPRIGLLSDSHGQAPTTHQAVEVLLGRGAELLIHLGDVGSAEVLDALARPAEGGGMVETHVIFGNSDWDERALSRYAADLGLQVDHPAGRIELAEGPLVFCHGHQHEVIRRALAEPVRYLCHGHSHRAEDRREGETRIINPGALFRARRYSVAVLDTDADQLAFYDVEPPA